MEADIYETIDIPANEEEEEEIKQNKNPTYTYTFNTFWTNRGGTEAMNKKKGCLRTEKSVSRMHRWPFELNGRVGGGIWGEGEGSWKHRNRVYRAD